MHGPLSSRVDHHFARLGIFLLVAALVLGVTNCAPIQHTLSIRSTLGGSVAVPGEGDFFYGTGEVVELVAEAEKGYRFVNWTGDVGRVADVNAPGTTVTVSSDCEVTANFIAQYSLTVSSTEGGEATAPGQGTFSYDAGTVVILVAVVGECYEFVSWSGDTVANPGSAITSITMDAPKSVTASFALLRYSLIVDSTEGGSVSTPGEGTLDHDCGTVVDLAAEPDEGCQFTYWSGSVGAVDDVNAASTSVTMMGDYTITANFAKEIRTWHDLDAIRNNLAGNYVLMNSLDSQTAGYGELASATANDGKGWQPIGTPSVDPIIFQIIAPISPFAGRFDGNGYEIRELVINRADASWVGLFACIDEGGIIEGVGLVNASVTGHDCVGGLAGGNYGIVSNSRLDGTVIGNHRVGGLAGWNKGTVSASHASGSVAGAQDVGGLVGRNDSTVTDSHAIGTVTGDLNVGGLLGCNWFRAIVRDSYSGGSVTGRGNVGGLVGVNKGTVTNSYSTASVSGFDGVGGGYVTQISTHGQFACIFPYQAISQLGRTELLLRR